jgi:hypothetical protein
MRGLPTRRTLHKAGPPVYEPVIHVARCARRPIADQQRRRAAPGSITSPTTGTANQGCQQRRFLNFCDARKRNFAFASRAG